MSLDALSPLPLVDVQEARASELRALGDYTGAHRVLMCGAEGAPWGRRWCRRRDCPACAQAAATRNAARVLEGMRRFRGESTVAVLLTSTVPLSRLAEGIKGFRAALSTLRKRDCIRNVLGAVGGIETKVTANEHMVNLHAHLALDVSGDLDERAIASAWRELTGGRFSVDPENREVLSPQRFGKYVSKPDTWSPEPGSLSLEALDLLRRGVKGKRLAVAWGTATKPHTPKAVETRVSKPSEAAQSHGGITPTEESMARQPPHDKTSKPVNSKWIPEGSRHAKPRKKEGRRRRGPISDVFIDPDSIDENGNPKKPTRRTAFEQGIRRAECFVQFALVPPHASNGPWKPVTMVKSWADEWLHRCNLPAIATGALVTALRRSGHPHRLVRGSLHYRVNPAGY